MVPEDQPGLPEPVAEMRRAIVAAAVACDLDGLAELGLEGDEDFWFGIGYIGDARDFWRGKEAKGSRPMWVLARLLDLPFTTGVLEEPEGGIPYYRWPTAKGSQRQFSTITLLIILSRLPS